MSSIDPLNVDISFDNIQLELESATFYEKPKNERLVIIAKATNLAKQSLDHIDKNDISRGQIKQAKKVIHSATEARDKTENVFDKFVRLLVCLISHRFDPLTKTQDDLTTLLNHLQSNVCKEDKRFLAIITNIMWAVEEKDAFSWDVKFQGKKIFQEGDKEFYESYLSKFLKRKDILKTLEDLTQKFANRESLGEEYDISLKGFQIGVELLKAATKKNSMLNPQKLDRMIGKLQALHDKITADTEAEISDKEKFSIKDFAFISKLHEQVSNINLLSKSGLLCNDIDMIVQKINKLNDLQGTVLGHINENTTYAPGDIGFQHCKKWFLSRGRDSLDWNARGQLLATWTNYNHAGILTKNNKLAQVQRSYVHEGITLAELTFTEFYRFNWDKLVTEDGKQLLFVMYGDEWKEKLSQKYQEATNQFYSDNSKFGNILNTDERRKDSIWQRHYLPNATKPDEISFKDQETFCTEFVSKSLFVYLDELDKNLNQEYGIETEQDLTDRQFKFFHNIFKDNENFAAAHPGYLEQRILEYVDRVDPSETLRKYVVLQKA